MSVSGGSRWFIMARVLATVRGMGPSPGQLVVGAVSGSGFQVPRRPSATSSFWPVVGVWPCRSVFLPFWVGLPDPTGVCSCS